jgi:23S rRNA (adenine2503-C2)-methyltransferase
MGDREPIPILGLTSDRFVEAAGAHDVRRPAALEAYRAVFRRGASDLDWVSVPARPIERLERDADTVKFTQRLPDGLETESVLLPQTSRTGRQRLALCVSSQVGCAMGCTFCETARMGLMRNLEAADIVEQWRAARFEFGADVTNVVFMGMGEPMDNLDAVITAIRVLADANGPAITPARVSVSTVGHVEGIKRLARFAAEEGFRRLRLAVSINAPNDGIRDELMPINRGAPLAELMTAMQEWAARPHRQDARVLIEYVLIPGVNDAPEHADELCAYLSPLPCTVNVIPYNPRRDSPWPAPAHDDVDRFVDRISATGQLVKRRRTMGRTAMAACGQLGNPRIRRRRFVEPDLP